MAVHWAASLGTIGFVFATWLARYIFALSMAAHWAASLWSAKKCCHFFCSPQTWGSFKVKRKTESSLGHCPTQLINARWTPSKESRVLALPVLVISQYWYSDFSARRPNGPPLQCSYFHKRFFPSQTRPPLYMWEIQVLFLIASFYFRRQFNLYVPVHIIFLTTHQQYKPITVMLSDPKNVLTTVHVSHCVNLPGFASQGCQSPTASAHGLLPAMCVKIHWGCIVLQMNPEEKYSMPRQRH